MAGSVLERGGNIRVETMAESGNRADGLSRGRLRRRSPCPGLTTCRLPGILLVQPHAMEAPSELVLSQFERLYRAFFGCTASNTSNAAPDEAAHVCPVCHEGSELRLIRQIDRVE